MDKEKLKEIIEKVFADTCNWMFDTTYFNDAFYQRLYDYVEYEDIENLFDFIDKHVQKQIASLPL